MQRHFGVNLGDLLHPRRDWPRLRCLIECLPPGFGDHAGWTLGDHLAAATVDLLAAANWQRGGKGPAPKPLPRPGREQKGVSPEVLDKVDAWRAQFMPRQGGDG